jgi:hypothetical protein
MIAWVRIISSICRVERTSHKKAVGLRKRGITGFRDHHAEDKQFLSGKKGREKRMSGGGKEGGWSGRRGRWKGLGIWETAEDSPLRPRRTDKRVTRS